MFPEASVVNPQHPATMNHYFPTAHLVYNTVLSALSKINPKRAVAPSGLGSGAVTIGYRKARGGKPAVLYELLNTSLGGTSAHDGVAVVMAMNHFTPGAPVEIVESEYPLRVRAFELIRNSAGAGTFRGGLGYAREFEVLEDSVLTVRSSNHKIGPKGLYGGGSPRLSRVVINPYGANPEELGALRRGCSRPVTSFVSSAAAEPGSAIHCCARAMRSPTTCATATSAGRPPGKSMV